jgi:hypothetical protein
MKTQRGSVLVGVVALSLAMSVAAGGLILLSGNAAKDNQMSTENLSLHYAAESGMYLGVNWMRLHPRGEMISSTWVGPLVLTGSGGGEYSSIDGIPVRVSFHDGPPGIRILKSIATQGAGKDTLELTWRVYQADSIDATHWKPRLNHWTETFRPGH